MRKPFKLGSAYFLFLIVAVGAAFGSCGRTGSIPKLLLETRDYFPDPASGLPSRPADGHTFSRVSYVPYVLSISVPDVVYEGEPFDVVLQVSANYRPAVLYGVPSNREAYVDAYMPGVTVEPTDALETGSDELVIDADWSIYLVTQVLFPLGTGAPTTEFHYQIEGLPAGSCRIAYFTTTDAEHGGIGWFFHEGGIGYEYLRGAHPIDPLEWIDKYCEKREIIIEVLPREESGN